MDIDTVSVSVPVVQKVTAATAVTATSAGIVLGITANELAAYASILIAFLALVANIAITIYFKNIHYKLVEKQLNKGKTDICDTCPIKNKE